jgi:hypothetical protein
MHTKIIYTKVNILKNPQRSSQKKTIFSKYVLMCICHKDVKRRFYTHINLIKSKDPQKTVFSKIASTS